MVPLEGSSLLEDIQEDNEPSDNDTYSLSSPRFKQRWASVTQEELSLPGTSYHCPPPRIYHRQSCVNTGDIERVRRFRKHHLGEDRRSSIATVSASESKALQQQQFNQLVQRVPTIADLEQINKTLSASVATFAEYNRFHGPRGFMGSGTSLSSGQVKSERQSKANLTGTEVKRPDDCIVVTSDPNSTERVTINVSGRIFQTYRFMFKRFSDGLLGNDEALKHYWDEEKKEYYFDHSSECFEGILQYYQTGFLRVPQHTHLRSFLESLEFFQFSTETINKLKKREAMLIDVPRPVPTNKLKRDIWLLLEEPESSRSAHIVALFSVAMILFSVLCFCWETLPEYSGQDCIQQKTLVRGQVELREVPVFMREFFLLETFFVFWFTLELLLRFLSCPCRLHFVKDLMNILDLLSILPYYISLIYTLSTMQCTTNKAGIFLMLRALRILRIFKLTRFSKGLRILTASLAASKNELVLVVTFVLMGSFAFAAFLYSIEMEYPHTQITSLLEGYWWGVATITTVGYGDVVPQSPLGKAASVVCIILGTLGLALPAPVIVANFNRYYRNETGRGFDDKDWMKR